jgi:hypothetical protein
VHVNDQTVADEENIEAFTEAQWMTLAGEIPQYPF